MISFNFKELINGIDNLPNELLNNNSVLYRIHDNLINKDYIGTAKYGMPIRLYDGFNGHVNLYKSNNLYKCRGMYHNMDLRLEDFVLFIEDTDSPSNYDRILLEETKLIEKFDSVLLGYNISIDGKPGWKRGTVCVNDGIYDLYIYEKDLNKFIDHGYKLGSCKHNFLKGTIFVHNETNSKMINPSELEKYEQLGFSKGNLNIPNKGKVWINNGVKSILIKKELTGLPEYKDFKFQGRIEKPRKKRGKYNSPKKKFVNNGIKEFSINADNVDKFLLDNQEYKLGRLKKNKY